MTSIVGTYWVGQIPGDALSIQVRDDRGTPVDLSSYTSYEVIMLDSDNNEINLNDAVLDTTSTRTGRFVFHFPTERSLFTTYGEYVFQLKMVGPGKIDFTSPFIMQVRKLGRR